MRPRFQLPFRCGQTWRASTYDGHYPDQDSLDFMLLSDGVNVSAGEDVLASASGTVTKACDTEEEDPPYGSVVRIEHKDGWMTEYVHLDDALSVQEGDVVKRGQKLGTVGGNIAIFGTENAHLHFVQWSGDSGVRQEFNGVPVDVHAGAKQADGTYPTQEIVSANCAPGCLNLFGGDDDESDGNRRGIVENVRRRAEGILPVIARLRRRR